MQHNTLHIGSYRVNAIFGEEVLMGITGAMMYEDFRSKGEGWRILKGCVFGSSLGGESLPFWWRRCRHCGNGKLAPRMP